MVNNSICGWVKEEIGREILPEDNLSDQEAGAVADYFFEDLGYSEADQVILHPGKTDQQNDDRYTLTEKVVFHLYSSVENPEIWFHECHRELAEESEVIHEDAVNFYDAETTAEEIAKISKENSRRIHITSDYHADGVADINEKLDSNDYLVIGTETPEEESREAFEAARKALNETIGPRYKGEPEIEKQAKKLYDKLS